MTNPNYIKGRRKEYMLCAEYRKKGYYIVQRTAGSHSAVDIIAINKKNKVITLIQAKPDNFSKSKEDKLMKEHSCLNSDYRVEFIVR